MTNMKNMLPREPVVMQLGLDLTDESQLRNDHSNNKRAPPSLVNYKLFNAL
ncbi:MAG: hypothetical protein JW759_05650 [Candidatus Coatesbacteria bacterium]|nr:hypothetical protein [Candidatus Coatesbacteria bacterium]